jgi:hypothetical protein
VLQNTSVDDSRADAIRSVAATQPIHQQHPDYRRSGTPLSVQRKTLAAPDPTASVECSAPTMRVERKYCVYAQPAMPILLMRPRPPNVVGKLAQQGPQRNCREPLQKG